MNNDSIQILDKAIKIAVDAHKGQVDKAGEPYILHPLRVMMQLDSTGDRIVAVLHDVLEDGVDKGFTAEYLRNERFPDEIINTLLLLTHNKSEPYETYVKKIADNPVARRVKLADLRDNMRIERIPNPTVKDYARIEKYKRALKLLELPE